MPDWGVMMSISCIRSGLRSRNLPTHPIPTCAIPSIIVNTQTKVSAISGSLCLVIQVLIATVLGQQNQLLDLEVLRTYSNRRRSMIKK